MQRDNIIDTAKGFGIFLVIAGHLFTYGGGYSCVVFSFHMPMFFFLSGYVFNTDWSRKQFYYKELNLLLPYLFFSVLGLMISLIIPAWRSFSAKQALLDIFYNVNPNLLHVGQVWFLFALIDIIALVYILNFLFEKEFFKLIAAFVLFGICFLIKRYQVGIYFRGESYRIPLKIDDAMAGLLFFYVGIVAKKMNVTARINVSKLWLRCSFFVVNALILVFFVKLNGMVNIDSNFNNPIFFLITSFAGIFMILVFSSLFANGKFNFISWFGKNSLPIFVFHSLFLYGYAYLLSKIFSTEIVIMNNVPDFWAFVGTILTAISSIPVVIFYNNTIAVLFRKINQK